MNSIFQMWVPLQFLMKALFVCLVLGAWMNYFVFWYNAGLERYEQRGHSWEFCLYFSNGVNLELHAIFIANNAKRHLQSSNGHQGTSKQKYFDQN